MARRQPVHTAPGVTAHPRARFPGPVPTLGPGAVPGCRVPRCHRARRFPLPPRGATAAARSTAGWLGPWGGCGPLTQRGRLGIHSKRCHRNGRHHSGEDLPSFQKWRKRSPRSGPRGLMGGVTSDHALCGGCGCSGHFGRGQTSLPGLGLLSKASLGIRGRV